VTVAIERLADGNVSRVKSIGEGAAEIRIDRGPGYRVYFGWDGPTLVVLLGGGTESAGSRATSPMLLPCGALTRRAKQHREEDKKCP
jgi:putative addiction module killer protein